MVALLVLAVTVSLGLRASLEARTIATQAWEVRRANTLIAYLEEAAPKTLGSSQGTSNGFAWKVETDAASAAQPIALCRRDIQIVSLARGQAYEVSTLETCPSQAAS